MKRSIAFLVFLLPATSLLGDSFVMKNGSVIEGKFKSYDPVKKTFTIEIDETGKTKVLKENDIQKRFAGKTTWERRAEFQKEYDKTKAPAVKPTWDSHQSLGKWCKTHLLGDKGDDHYRIALRLRTEQLVADIESGKYKPEDEIEHRIKIAKWCEKELGLFPEARGEYTIAYGVKRAIAGEDATADFLFNIAKWCEQLGLEDQAVHDYEVVLEMSPKHSGAKTQLDKIKNSTEFRLKLLAAEYEKFNRAWHLTVTIEEGVDKKFLEDWQDRMQLISDYVWNITEGQFYIAECEIEDNATDGKIIVEKGKLDWYGMDNKEGMGVLAYCAASGTPRWEIHCPGHPSVSCMCHEMFHGVFGFPDEYYQNPQCDCVMRSAPNPQKVCTDKSAGHIANTNGPPGSEGKHCWEIIVGRAEFKNTPKHPNPNWTWAKPLDQNGEAPMEPPKGLKETRAEGPRNPGGELRWGNLKVAQAPKTVIRLIDN